MPKIVRKKMCFLGERVRAGVEPALCVKELEARLHARVYACHTSGGRYPEARRAVVQPCPNVEL